MIPSRLRRLIYWLLELVPCEVCGALVTPGATFELQDILKAGAVPRFDGRGCWPCATLINQVHVNEGIRKSFQASVDAFNAMKPMQPRAGTLN